MGSSLEEAILFKLYQSIENEQNLPNVLRLAHINSEQPTSINRLTNGAALGKGRMLAWVQLQVPPLGNMGSG